jgi:uncharacterized protein with PIN domain
MDLSCYNRVRNTNKTVLYSELLAVYQVVTFLVKIREENRRKQTEDFSTNVLKLASVETVSDIVPKKLALQNTKLAYIPRCYQVYCTDIISSEVCDVYSS